MQHQRKQFNGTIRRAYYSKVRSITDFTRFPCNFIYKGIPTILCGKPFFACPLSCSFKAFQVHIKAVYQILLIHSTICLSSWARTESNRLGLFILPISSRALHANPRPSTRHRIRHVATRQPVTLLQVYASSLRISSVSTVV